MRPRKLRVAALLGSASWMLVGSVGGLAFGALLGALASFFDGGPAFVVGVTESARWFAVAGAASGWLFAVSKPCVDRS